MVESGEYLVNVCNDDIANDVDRQLAKLSPMADDVLAACEEAFKAEIVQKKKEEFDAGVSILCQWLDSVESSLQQPVPVEYGSLKGHMQDMEVRVREEQMMLLMKM